MYHFSFLVLLQTIFVYYSLGWCRLMLHFIIAEYRLMSENGIETYLFLSICDLKYCVILWFISAKRNDIRPITSWFVHSRCEGNHRTSCGERGQ